MLEGVDGQMILAECTVRLAEIVVVARVGVICPDRPLYQLDCGFLVSGLMGNDTR